MLILRLIQDGCFKIAFWYKSSGIVGEKRFDRRMRGWFGSRDCSEVFDISDDFEVYDSSETCSGKISFAAPSC